MTVLRAGDAGFCRTSSADLPADGAAAAVDHLAAVVADLAVSRGSGLLDSALLLSGSRAGQPDDGTVRLVHLTRWADEAQADRAGESLTLRPGPHEPLQGHVVHDLAVHDIVTASPSGQVRLAEDGPATFVITMDSAPEHHGFLTQLNADDTRRIFAPLTGFVACAIFSDRRAHRVFEIAQWELPEHFFAAASTPAFAEHIAAVDERCHTTDARVYRVLHVARGAGQDVG